MGPLSGIASFVVRPRSASGGAGATTRPGAASRTFAPTAATEATAPARSSRPITAPRAVPDLASNDRAATPHRNIPPTARDPRPAEATAPGPRDTDTGRVARARTARALPSLEEAATRAVAEAAASRRRLAREVRDLPPPLDTRLALLASVAEIRTAMVPPRLTTLDRRR